MTKVLYQTVNSVRKGFHVSKVVNFYIKDKERPGQPKKFEYDELKAFLDEDPYQTQDELAKSLGVDRSTVGKRLKALGFIQKKGNRVPHELKPIIIMKYE